MYDSTGRLTRQYVPEIKVSVMKVTISREECTSCGTCRETCPDIFEQNPDDSLNQIVEKYRLNGNIAEGVPPRAFEDCTLLLC